MSPESAWRGAEHAVPELHLGPAHDEQSSERCVVLLVGGGRPCTSLTRAAFGRDVREGHGLNSLLMPSSLRCHDHGHGSESAGGCRQFGNFAGTEGTRNRSAPFPSDSPGIVYAADDVRLSTLS